MNDKNTENMSLLPETIWFHSTEWKKKQIWSSNEAPFLTVKLSGKNKAMKQDFFIRIPTDRQCDLNAKSLCIILRE